MTVYGRVVFNGVIKKKKRNKIVCDFLDRWNIECDILEYIYIYIILLSRIKCVTSDFEKDLYLSLSLLFLCWCSSILYRRVLFVEGKIVESLLDILVGEAREQVARVFFPKTNNSISINRDR